MDKAELQRHIVEGSKLNVALAVDTCIFEQHGHRLESGQLKHLEQFKSTPGTVVIPDVVKREVLAHMVNAAVQAKSTLKTALSAARDHWPSSTITNTSLTDLLGSVSEAEEVSSKRLDSFLERCAATVVKAEGHVSIAEVVERYFQTAPPFEKSGSKKHEFPDAIALLALENWAAEHEKYVLLVSRDKGWQMVADASDRLLCVIELDDALEMFQTRDSTRTKMVEHVASLLDVKNWDGLDELANLLDSTQWIADASSMFDYDMDFHVDVESVCFANDEAADALRAIDYSGDLLTVIADFEAKVAVDANFAFVMEGVYLGGCVVSKSMTVEFEALISFKNPGGDKLQAVDIDLVRKIHTLDLGEVQPDYSEHDLTFEKY